MAGNKKRTRPGRKKHVVQMSSASSDNDDRSDKDYDPSRDETVVAPLKPKRVRKSSLSSSITRSWVRRMINAVKSCEKVWKARNFEYD